MDNALLTGILVGVIANLVQDWMARHKVEDLLGQMAGQRYRQISDRVLVASIVVYVTIHLRDEHEEEFHTADQIAHPVAELVEQQIGLH